MIGRGMRQVAARNKACFFRCRRRHQPDAAFGFWSFVRIAEINRPAHRAIAHPHLCRFRERYIVPPKTGIDGDIAAEHFGCIKPCFDDKQTGHQFPHDRVGAIGTVRTSNQWFDAVADKVAEPPGLTGGGKCIAFLGITGGTDQFGSPVFVSIPTTITGLDRPQTELSADVPAIWRKS